MTVLLYEDEFPSNEYNEIFKIIIIFQDILSVRNDHYLMNIIENSYDVFIDEMIDNKQYILKSDHPLLYNFIIDVLFTNKYKNKPLLLEICSEIYDNNLLYD